MLSESARMSSAAEAGFRIQAENSKPRAIKVVALDAQSEGVVKDSLSESVVLTEVDAADLVVMVASPGGHAHAAALIGEACNLKGVVTTALIVGATSASREALSKTLAQVRPWSQMVVIADSDDYVNDLLTALRA